MKKYYLFQLSIQLMLMGTSLSAQSSSSESISELLLRIKQGEAKRSYREVARAYDRLAVLYDQKYGFNRFSLDAHQKSKANLGLLGDSVGFYRKQIKIGDYYLQDGYLRKLAPAYYLRAYRFFDRRPGSDLYLLQCQAGLGDCYLDMRQFKQAAQQLNAALKLSRSLQRHFYEAYVLNLLSNYHLVTQDYPKVHLYAEQSIALNQASWVNALNWFYKGLAEKYQQHYTDAAFFLEKSQRIASKIMLKNVNQSVSFHLAECYQRLGNTQKAWTSLHQSRRLLSNLHDSEFTRNIRLAEVNNQVQALRFEKDLFEQKQRNQRNLLLGAGIVLALLLVIAISLWKLVIKQRQINAQNEIIRLKQQKQLRFESLIEGQERERLRIARDLHDGLGALLARIRLYIETYPRVFHGKISQDLLDLIDEACEDTRQIANNLRPYAIGKYGIKDALELLVEKSRLVSSANIYFHSYIQHFYPEEEKNGILFRIAQELLNNAIKHSQATEINLDFMQAEDVILLNIEDDGRGFDPAQVETGNGIANVQARVAFLDGHIHFESAPGRGTSVQISLPTGKN